MDQLPEESRCVVDIKDGPICGYVDKLGERSYYKFKSIPYAKPPVGQLRFLPPSPIPPWTELKDCTIDAPEPIYRDLEGIKGSEDCLYIEISTPDLTPDKPLPVMFWFGCFKFACTIDKMLDPTLINDQNVVYVRCGFRMGVFGFLSMNDIMAPGNAGLKDVVMALKWIQNNISFFGGDKDNVTLFGTSSGGAIVHLLMLSPMATGLFHKAIIQSGCALNIWSLAKNPFQPVMELAKGLGLSTTNNIEILEELKTLPSEDILKADILHCETEINYHNIFNTNFKPSVEDEFEGQPAFLTKSPHNIIRSGNFNKVPLIIGSNNIEGSLIKYINADFYNFEKYNENVQLLVPKSLAGEEKMSVAIGHQLLKFYLGEDEAFTKDTQNQYLQLISDYYFLYYVNNTVRLHSKVAPNSPIYYYIANYCGEWDVPEYLEMFNSGGHISELPFIFGIKESDKQYKGSRDSIRTRARVVKMWTNFAKYGNPTPDEDDPLLQIKWDPVESEEKLNYLSIGSELTKGRNPFYDRMTFWDNLHKEHTFLRVLVYFNDLGVSW